VEKWKERIWILGESKSRSDLLFDVLGVVAVIMRRERRRNRNFYMERNGEK
jgi:hypothetical protein